MNKRLAYKKLTPLMNYMNYLQSLEILKALQKLTHPNITEI